MARWLLKSSFGPTYKAGSVLSDEAGDPIAALIAGGAPIVPSLAGFEATAAAIAGGFPGSPDTQKADILANYLVVEEEGTVVSIRPALNFVGAGVTVTDDAVNNRTLITIAAEAITGWTDGGTLVYPTTATDDVAIGVQAMEGTERLRVRNSVPLVASLESIDAGAVGATLAMYHNSANPADQDVIARFSFFGNDDNVGLNKTEYMRIDVVAGDVSDTTEDGQFRIFARIGGTLEGTPCFIVDHYGSSFSSRLNATSGGELGLVFDKGAAGANNDVLGYVGWYGPDDGSNLVEWIYWSATVVDAGAASKDSRLALNLLVANVDTEVARFDANGLQLARSVGMFGVTPPAQHAKIADPAGGGTVDAESRTAIAAIIDVLEGLGASALV